MLPQYYGLHKKNVMVHLSHGVETACFSRGFKSFLVLFPILLFLYAIYLENLSFFCLLFWKQGQCDFVSEMRKHGDCLEQIQSVDGKREPFAAASLRSLVHNFSSPKSGENGTRLPPFTKNSSWLFGFGLSFPVDSA